MGDPSKLTQEEWNAINCLCEETGYLKFGEDRTSWHTVRAMLDRCKPVPTTLERIEALEARIAKLEGLSDPSKLETFSMSLDDPRFVGRDDPRFFDGPRRP